MVVLAIIVLLLKQGPSSYSPWEVYFHTYRWTDGQGFIDSAVDPLRKFSIATSACNKRFWCGRRVWKWLFYMRNYPRVWNLVYRVFIYKHHTRVFGNICDVCATKLRELRFRAENGNKGLHRRRNVLQYDLWFRSDLNETHNASQHKMRNQM